MMKKLFFSLLSAFLAACIVTVVKAAEAPLPTAYQQYLNQAQKMADSLSAADIARSDAKKAMADAITEAMSGLESKDKALIALALILTVNNSGSAGPAQPVANINVQAPPEECGFMCWMGKGGTALVGLAERALPIVGQVYQSRFAYLTQAKQIEAQVRQAEISGAVTQSQWASVASISNNGSAGVVSVANNSVNALTTLGSNGYAALNNLGNNGYAALTTLGSNGFGAMTIQNVNATGAMQTLGSNGYQALTTLGQTGFVTMNNLGNNGFSALTTLGSNGYSALNNLGNNGFGALNNLGNNGFGALNNLGNNGFSSLTTLGTNGYSAMTTQSGYAFGTISNIVQTLGRPNQYTYNVGGDFAGRDLTGRFSGQGSGNAGTLNFGNGLLNTGHDNRFTSPGPYTIDCRGAITSASATGTTAPNPYSSSGYVNCPVQ